MRQRFLRLAADQKPFEPAASVGADNNEIGAGIFSSFDDAGVWQMVVLVYGLAIDACGFGLLSDVG